MRASRPWKGHRRTDLLSVGEFRENPEVKQVMSMKLHAGTAFRHNFRKLCRFVVTSSACDKVQIRINIGPALLRMRAHSSSSCAGRVASPQQPIDRSLFPGKDPNTRAIGWSNKLLHLCPISTKLSHCQLHKLSPPPIAIHHFIASIVLIFGQKKE